jgi:hypothetical protein
MRKDEMEGEAKEEEQKRRRKKESPEDGRDAMGDEKMTERGAREVKKKEQNDEMSKKKDQRKWKTEVQREPPNTKRRCRSGLY